MGNAYLKVFGLLLAVFGASMLPPATVSLIYADGHLEVFLWIGAAGLVLGAAGMFLGPPVQVVLRTRDGFLAVSLAWVAMSLFGAIPFVLLGGLDPATAIFESASGFTTTGSTAIADLDPLP
ncbi:MAG TPA: potassium transporter, partial [Woeseiaceae bacterium]|nr:potassium transporter [Woeseiaceae bacterium]